MKPVYPRINCTVPGCERGSTRFAPGSEVICGDHWRKVPIGWRRRFALYRRRYNAARQSADPHGMEVACSCFAARWSHIVALLTRPDSVMVAGLPATIAEELRREALL